MVEGGISKMCIICVQLQQDKLTSFEARRNFGEMVVTLGDHAEEVEKKIVEKEIEELLQLYVEPPEED